MDFLLGLGIGTDTITDDRIDLTESPYMVLAERFAVREDAADPRYQYVILGLHIKGSNHNALLDARRAILNKLYQATLAPTGSPVDQWVTLGVSLTAADAMVWWHVVSGDLTAHGAFWPHSNVIGTNVEPLELTLRCVMGAYGTPFVDEPVGITGASPVLYRPNIPGDLPARVEIDLEDTSTGGVIIHGFSIGSRSAVSMTSGQYVPFHSLMAIEDGTGNTDTDAFGGTIIEATAAGAWKTVAEVEPTSLHSAGEHDIWLRWRDSAALLGVPTGISIVRASGGSLPAGGYQYRVTALASSVESAASNIHTTVLASGTGTVNLDWATPESGTPTGYRVYWKRGTEPWKYLNTGSTSTSYSHTTETGHTVADPPNASSVTPADVRIGLALGDGPVTHYTTPIRATLANDRWEWSRITTEHLPPVAVPLAATQPDYRLVVQVRSTGTGGAVTLDAVALMPADEAWFDARVPNGSLAALRRWLAGTNQGGHSYSYTLNPSDDSDPHAGQSQGKLEIGPGDVKLALLLRGTNGAALVENAAANVTLTIYSRYRWLAGGL